MTKQPKDVHDYARIALAIIRLINGALALVAPGFLAERLGVDAKANPAMLYVFRMFGIRTVLVAIDLLRSDGEQREAALRAAPMIHASDTTAAIIAGLTGVPRRPAVTIVIISSINTILAIVARMRPAATAA